MKAYERTGRIGQSKLALNRKFGRISQNKSAPYRKSGRIEQDGEFSGRRQRKRSGSSRRQALWGWLFVLPGLAGVLAFYLFPFLDVVRRSFVSAMGGGFVGIANYRTVAANEAFRLAAANTLRFAALCLPLLLLLSLGLAVLLQSLLTASGSHPGLKRSAKLAKSAYLVPLAVPAASIVLLWQLVFDVRGLLNGWLSALGLPGRDWMHTEAAFGVLVFSYLWKNIGYDVVLWLAGLSAVPVELYEAARVDGAGRTVCFFRITLPAIRPMAVTIVIVSFLNSFKVFREAYLVAGNYPQDNIYLLQHLFNNWFRELSMDKMAAGAVLLALVILALVLLLEKSWNREETV
ncbi:MAG: sugar ABC transporter permease [Lachnospiraceae bacterium]|nr:sugar ABC transporter permease [Lachnospiraceae bacterium]